MYHFLHLVRGRGITTHLHYTFLKTCFKCAQNWKKNLLHLLKIGGDLGSSWMLKLLHFIKWRVPFLRLSIKDIKKSVHESFYGAGVFVLDYIMCRHNIIRSIDTDISIHISLWTGSSVSQHSHCIVTIINCITTKQQALSAVSPLWLWKLRDQ